MSTPEEDLPPAALRAAVAALSAAAVLGNLGLGLDHAAAAAAAVVEGLAAARRRLGLAEVAFHLCAAALAASLIAWAAAVALPRLSDAAAAAVYVGMAVDEEALRKCYCFKFPCDEDIREITIYQRAT